jgi:glycerol-3-phosphate acyltransferase PlsY
LQFKGGKAVATTIGVFLALAPWTMFFSVICCLAVIALSGYVSMGSLTLALALPVFSLLTGNIGMIPLSLGVMLFLFWRHRENILRLDKGQEMPWRRRKDDPATEPPDLEG